MTTTAVAPAKKNQTFAFRAEGADGKPKSGTAVATTREAAIAKLAANPDYTSILSVRQTGTAVVGKKSRPKARAMVAASRQLAMYLEVGYDERAAITEILDDGEIGDVVLAHGLTQVLKDMSSEGVKMHEAMAKHPYIFPELMTKTLAAGDKGGFVAQAANQVANDLESEDEQRAKVKKALTYPMVVLALSSAIFVFLMMYVVPKFGAMYKDLSHGKASLPFLTQAVMAVSAQMAWAVPLLAVLGVIGTIWYRRNSKDAKVRGFVDPFKLKLPVFGKLFRDIALTKFCRIMASLAENNVHITDALAITAGSVGNIVMEQAVLKARDGKLKGQSIMEPLRQEPLFPKMLLKFLALGEDTGETAKSLRAVGKLYERDVDHTTNNMEAYVQPIFLIGIAGMVLIIALAIYLPYFSLGDVIAPY
ncbi:type II secretion system F family protein [Paenarthrobacter sp. YJN-5]|uniref:type II secretion system F family protein n=1 Tax=unclassified Paenarthrobacter TaxID=2634190 RepID=UPI00187803D3|nr:type II secretion system F family protein [Paenarthrobacter sp. YJN-5]QOT19466.1 type II secretion system F family protein [Paenarthrobacter sp. YJN-5]